MTLHEHKRILAFLDLVLNGEHSPLDIEADAVIRAYFKRHPDTAYRLTMMAMSLLQTAEPDMQDKPKRRGWLPALLRGWQF